MQPASQSAIEARIERDFQRDQRLRWVFSIGAPVISLATFVTLYVLTIALGRTSPWLVTLPVYSIVTTASAYVSRRAFLYPRFLVLLDDPDPDRSAAAAAVLERHRPAIARPILKEVWRDFDPAAIAALEATEVASLARKYDIERQRRFGRRWLIGWCLLSLVMWGTLIATGAGPSR